MKRKTIKTAEGKKNFGDKKKLKGTNKNFSEKYPEVERKNKKEGEKKSMTVVVRC